MGELRAGAAALVASYRGGVLPEERLAPEIADLPEKEVGDVLLAVYAEMRGVDEEEATREIHERLLESEIAEVLEEMVERGELERVAPEDGSRPEAGGSESDVVAEDAWSRFATVFEATGEAVRRNALPEPRPSSRRWLRGAAFARHRGVDYSTVWKWRRAGLLPEARGGGAIGAPVFIPDDATVLDRDLAAAHPPGVALVLQWYRHADSEAARGHAVVRALRDLPEDLTGRFFDTVAAWEEEKRRLQARGPTDEELRAWEQRRREEQRRIEPVPPLVNLRELRQERGLSRPALAARAKKSYSLISKAEDRASRGLGMSRETAEALAAGLGVEPETLWEPLGKPPRRYLSARASAMRRGGDVGTVGRWLRDGRLPEAAPTPPGANRLIPEDATVVDRDLARTNPGLAALFLHRRRHGLYEDEGGFAEDLARLGGEEFREALVTVAAEDTGRGREDVALQLRARGEEEGG